MLRAQVVADRRAVPGRFEDHGDEIARRDSQPTRDVLPDRGGRPAHTRLAGAAWDVLHSHEEEPISLYIAYGRGARHCLRHIFELSDPAALHQLSRR